MFRWFAKNPDRSSTGLNRIKKDFIQMLKTAQHEFTLACQVTLLGKEPQEIKDALLQADKQVNKFERQIRKELVVHCSVVGHVDPESLVMMSISKDAERLGDYAKNIFDLGMVVPVQPEGEDRERLLILMSLVERILDDCQLIFENNDEELARKVIREGTWINRQCDHNTNRLLQLEQPNRHTAPNVLLFRYMKRIISHLRNICSSMVQPVHKLDFTSKLTRDVDHGGDLLDWKEDYLDR